MAKSAKMQLNEAQKTAITHASGPLLVVAGAGTGKTRVITERIKYLVNDKHIDSNSILALTFTEKAAHEMAQRVEDAMPLGYQEPWIYTFHSFADRILREEGLEIGLDPSYKIISSSDQWLLLRKNLFNLDLQYFLPLGNPTKFISAILKFISRLQDEYISVEDLDNFVKTASGEEEDLVRWAELAKVYRKYQQLKMQNSKFDFGDLINWTIRLFNERPEILKKYQKQFSHVLVDEFQDTNYAQYLLVKKLCPQILNERSLLVVGDDSQSIYKFRGAAVSNILEFMKDYPTAQMLTLTQNYRSNQSILDASYNMVQNNNPDTLESKLGISKKLSAHSSAGEHKPNIYQVETLEDEVEHVISTIYEILAKEPTYTYKDIAILARANSHLDAFVMALRKHGLPYQLVGNRGLYDQDEIRDIWALLKVIINPKDSLSLYRVLNITSFEIPKEVITQLLSLAKYKKQDIWEIIPSLNNDQLQLFYKLIINFQNKITKLTPVEFIYNLVNEAKYLNQYVLVESIENKLSLKNLNLFLNIVKKFEIDFRADTKNLPSVVDFADHIELLLEAGDNPAQAEIEDVDTINLMTVHAAKGLEFPVVFIVNLVTGRFPSQNRSDAIAIPDALIKETLPSGDEHVQEERRLFYVAMTRAIKYLIMTCAKNYGGAKERVPSGYLAETGIKIQNPEKILAAFDDENKQTDLFGVESEFRNTANTKTDFTPSFLSYSQIETYKTCPLKYKYSYILNIPTPPSHALSFGITIHDTLRDLHQKLNFSPVTLDEVFTMYEKNWQPLGYLDENHRQIRFEAGKKFLTKYYGELQKQTKKILGLEKSFNIIVEGIKFYGRIDRIDELEDGVEIIDYKTGSAKTQKEVDKDDQVAFYAIATKEALKLDPKKLTYYFVETGDKVSTTRTDAQLEEKKADVKQVLAKIKTGHFEPKSGMHCNWCDYKNICPFAYKD